MRWRSRLDIPLHRDGSSRFLPWIIALMVYLAGLALSGTLAVDGALQRWNSSLAGTLTVEIPAAAVEGKGDGGLGAALVVLRATPGVRHADPLDANATAKLVAPWLGTGLTADELPLPRLVDVRIDPGAPLDLTALRARLETAAPGAVLDDHRLWLDRLVHFARSIEATALAIVALIGAAAVLTVVFTTRTGLAVHHDVIELLHIMGARDGYIARQFAREALRLGLRGGLIGFALAALTLLGLSHAAAATALIGAQVKLLPPLHLTVWHWIALLLLPAVAALIAMLTARSTVLRALARMP
jgi:cell division transport system permease protein